MKSLIKFIFLIIISKTCFAQGPSIAWQKSYGSNGVDLSQCIRPTSDGGYIVMATSGANNGDVIGNKGLDDVWIIKINNIGNIQWQKNYGGSAYDRGYDIRQTPDGGYLILASTSSSDMDVTYNHGGVDVWVLKLNSSGNIQWQKCYGGSGNEFSYLVGRIISTYDGGYCFITSTTSSNGDVTNNHGGGGDAWCVKLDNIGNIQWQKCYGGSGLDFGLDVIQTIDSNYVISAISGQVSGDITQNYGTEDAWLIRINNSGVIQWQKSYGGPGGERPYSIKQTSDKGLCVL